MTGSWLAICRQPYSVASYVLVHVLYVLLRFYYVSERSQPSVPLLDDGMAIYLGI
jgi:hypothetical protein